MLGVVDGALAACTIIILARSNQDLQTSCSILENGIDFEENLLLCRGSFQRNSFFHMLLIHLSYSPTLLRTHAIQSLTSCINI